MQRPVRIGKMRPRKAHQIGTAGHQYRVHMIGLVDVADRERGDTGLVANAVGEWRLEHSAIDRASARRGLPGRHVDEIDTSLRETLRNLDRLLRSYGLQATPIV